MPFTLYEFLIKMTPLAEPLLYTVSLVLERAQMMKLLIDLKMVNESLYLAQNPYFYF